jgi:hypothetical protein
MMHIERIEVMQNVCFKKTFSIQKKKKRNQYVNDKKISHTRIAIHFKYIEAYKMLSILSFNPSSILI